jgi:hypothetical protein
MRFAWIFALLLLSAPAAAEIVDVRCPNGVRFVGDLTSCPCCEECPDGPWYVKGKGSCDSGTTTKTRKSPRSEARAQEPRAPFELTEIDITEVNWSSSRDLSVLGYRLGQVVGGAREPTPGVRIIEAKHGLEIRVDERDRITLIFIEEEFANHLPGTLGELMRAFRPDRMREIFGVEDPTPEENAERKELAESARRLGLDFGTMRGHRYARLGVEIQERSEGRAAIRLFPPAARR